MTSAEQSGSAGG